MRIAFLLPVVLCASALPGQLRRPCLGKVVDEDGNPLGNAEVTLVWTPETRVPGEPEVLHATADARGRFRADLIVGRAYSAWAIGPTTDDGSRPVSGVTDRAAAGVVLELAAWRRWQPRNLRVEGGGVPELLLFPDARSAFSIALVPSENGTVELPPTPWIVTLVALCERGGAIAQVETIRPEDPAPRIAFQPPREIDLQVVGKDGDPVARAVVEQMLLLSGGGGDAILRPPGRFDFRPAAVTNDRGRARLRIPVIDRGVPAWIRVGTRGTAWTYAPLAAAQRSEPDAPQQLRLTIVDTAVSEGRVLGLRDGEIPLAQLLTGIEHRQDRQTSGLRLGLPVAVGTHGELRVERVPSEARDWSLVLHLLPSEEGTPRYAISSPVREPLRALPKLGLDAMGTCRLRAFDVDNNPIPGAEVLVFPVSDQPMFGNAEGTHFVLDHAGRADFVLDEGRWGIYVTDGAAHALHFVDGLAGGDVRLRLEAMPTLTCRVVDAEARPVRGARIEAKGLGGFSGRLEGAEDWAKEAIAAMIAIPCAEAARSDRDGMLVLPIQDWRPMNRPVWVRAGDRVSAPFPLEAAHEIRTVVLH